jgi:hypothetical protein
MAVAGVLLLLTRYGILGFSFSEGWEQRYTIQLPEKRARAAEADDKPGPPKPRAVRARRITKRPSARPRKGPRA